MLWVVGMQYWCFSAPPVQIAALKGNFVLFVLRGRVMHAQTMVGTREGKFRAALQYAGLGLKAAQESAGAAQREKE